MAARTSTKLFFKANSAVFFLILNCRYLSSLFLRFYCPRLMKIAEPAYQKFNESCNATRRGDCHLKNMNNRIKFLVRRFFCRNPSIF